MKTITINTHIDCSNNSKCSVRDILLATKQGAFESVFGTFSVKIPSSSIVRRLWGGKAHAADGRECSNWYKINFVRAVACTPSFTCAPHSRIWAPQLRLRETLTKCPLQTLHYYNISTHNIGPKQTEISSPTQRLLWGDMGCHDLLDIPGRTQSKGHPSQRNDLER